MRNRGVDLKGIRTIFKTAIRENIAKITNSPIQNAEFVIIGSRKMPIGQHNILLVDNFGIRGKGTVFDTCFRRNPVCIFFDNKTVIIFLVRTVMYRYFVSHPIHHAGTTPPFRTERIYTDSFLDRKRDLHLAASLVLPVFGCRFKADTVTGTKRCFQRTIRIIERTIDLLHLCRLGLLTVDIYYNGTIGNTIRLLFIGIDHTQRHSVFFLSSFKKSIHQKLWDLLDDLKETLAQANGVGLAAPQVGILRRAVIVMDENFEPMELVNPEILAQEGEQNGLEGCLSVPGLWGYVKRPEWVKVLAFGRNGNAFEVEGTGLTARCFCHELAHLDGQLYTDLADRIYTTEELDAMLEEQGK